MLGSVKKQQPAFFQGDASLGAFVAFNPKGNFNKLSTAKIRGCRSASLCPPEVEQAVLALYPFVVSYYLLLLLYNNA